jgi:hypothetical protein
MHSSRDKDNCLSWAKDCKPSVISMIIKKGMTRLVMIVSSYIDSVIINGIRSVIKKPDKAISNL